jgi:hypothetical protein
MPLRNSDRRDTLPEETLIGIPRISRILGVSRPTAQTYADRDYFPTIEIEGRDYARMADVLAYKAEREAGTMAAAG